MSDYLSRARQAFNLWSKGLDIGQLKAKLKLTRRDEIDQLIAVGKAEQRFLSAKLNDDEVCLIRNIGRAHLRDLERGCCSSLKLKYCGRHFWSRGKAERVAKKRLNTDHLSLLHAYHGGYVYLTPAGWALFHTLEDVRPVE